jgi:hypothetical protein
VGPLSEAYRRANDADTWYSAAIKPSEEPELKRVKFWEDAFKVPLEERTWVLEASGRLLSLARSIRQDADERARKANEAIANANRRNRSFRGIRSAQVATLRNGARLDVFSEPTEDPAHANIVVLSEADCDRLGDQVKIAQDLALALDGMMPFIREDHEVIAELERRCAGQGSA